MSTRVIAALDADAFCIQVAAKKRGLDPDEVLERPVVVNSAISAVTSKAKDYGVVRGMSDKTLAKIQRRHPDLEVMEFPKKFGKVNDLLIRMAGDDIYEAINSALRTTMNGLHTNLSVPIVEKPYCDEFFIDLTEVVELLREQFEHLSCKQLFSTLKTGKRKLLLELREGSVTNHDSCKENGFHLKGLILGAKIINDVQNFIKKKTEFVMSAGIGRNKLQAKMACNLGKTKCKGKALCVLPSMSWERVTTEIPLRKIPGLGGKLGDKIMHAFEIQNISELASIGIWRLGELLGNQTRAEKIINQSLGIDGEPVLFKHLSSTIRCGKSINTQDNMIHTKRDFLRNLYGRFHEMRDKLVYEYERYERLPEYLRLEIQIVEDNATGKSIIFKEKYPLNSYRILELIELWQEEETYAAKKHYKPVLGWFKAEINSNYKSRALFKKDGHFVPFLRHLELSAHF